ncbi:MAG: ADP-forming succinate--CoA ligase subunit beta [Spirochaetaceae bacterium]|nr:MAG: ADP-forming succinate--CoA ligase subunit beta [Spirochaetaceae bacterium]
MKIHEYQARELLASYGVPLPPGKVARSAEEAVQVAEGIGLPVVIKAQVLVGGRGKAGGVKLAGTPEEVRKAAGKILDLTIKDIPVEAVLVAKAVDIQKEYYLSVTVDRANKKVVCIVSASGGVDIEELAMKEPEKILKAYIDPLKGPDDKALRSFLSAAFPSELLDQAVEVLLNLYRLLVDKDCSLVEINPYAQIDAATLVAADAKINFDDNGLPKHADVEALRTEEEYSREEIEAKEAGLSFVSLEGDIGCIVNGAGLAMATMDLIKLFGGQPANFLDVGGSSSPQKVLTALQILTRNQKLKAILINIFGGITRCDDIAKGILIARDQIDLPVPLVIRLIGTNEAEGRALLEQAGLEAASEMTEAVKKVLEKAKAGV